jgi:hypothetical protein
VLLGISVWIRMQLNESPLFQQMKAEGKTSKAPLRESFGNWGNGKMVLLALFGATAGQAVVWYAGQFYALFFLTQTLKVDATTANLLIAGALISARRSSSCSAGCRPDRAQADRAGRLPARRADLFPDLPGADARGEPGAGSRRATAPVTVAPIRRLLVPVRSGRHPRLHQLLRHRQERRWPSGGTPLCERRRAAGSGRHDPHRRRTVRAFEGNLSG